MNREILIIEDDNSIAELVRDYLQMNNFAADIAADGKTGLDMALTGSYDLIIIDVMLPVIDGFTICTEIRRKRETPIIFLSARSDDIDKIRGLGLGADDYITKPFSPNELIARVKAHIARRDRITEIRRKRETPIIFLSARSDDIDKIRGLGLGADDYITKPFSPNELIARVKAHIARRDRITESVKNPIDGTLTVRGLTIDKNSRRVMVAGRETPFTAKEYDLLLYLAEHPGRTFTKEQLFNKIWGMDSLGDISTVTVHIQRIREKIRTGSDKYIETVWGVGYRFV